MNTHASACCSALAWLYMSQRSSGGGGKPSFIAVANGSVAGLAAITPAAGAFSPCTLSHFSLGFLASRDFRFQATSELGPP